MVSFGSMLQSQVLLVAPSNAKQRIQSMSHCWDDQIHGWLVTWPSAVCEVLQASHGQVQRAEVSRDFLSFRSCSVELTLMGLSGGWSAVLCTFLDFEAWSSRKKDTWKVLVAFRTFSNGSRQAMQMAWNGSDGLMQRWAVRVTNARCNASICFVKLCWLCC